MVHRKIIWVSLSVIVALVIAWFLLSRFLFPLMWNFLVLDETPEKSDVIIVLSGDIGRAEYGIELYKQGYADYILFCGGGSRSMKQTAIFRGVAEGKILLDSKSSTTYENASNSADIMRDHNFQSAIVVTSAYHTKRSSIIFAQYISRDNYIICAVPYSSSAGEWWKDTHLRKMVILEYLKLTYHYWIR